MGTRPDGVGLREDFDPPAPDPKFHSCGCGFLFQLVDDPQPTRNLAHSFFAQKILRYNSNYIK